MGSNNTSILVYCFIFYYQHGSCGRDDDGDIFVYMGGIAPLHVMNAIIDKSVKEIDDEAFCSGSGSDGDEDNPNLHSVEFHAGVERIGDRALAKCPALRRIKLPGVAIIGLGAFRVCTGLKDAEFGDKLESIEDFAFYKCSNLKGVTIPSVRWIGPGAFCECTSLTDAEFGEELEEFGLNAFYDCSALRRIAIPLKDDMFDYTTHYQSHNGILATIFSYTQFDGCTNLSTVELVGGIHETVASLLLEKWRNEMSEEINRINRVLPVTGDDKTDAIRLWIQSVIRNIEHYKTEHKKLLKEATTILELALWKATIDWSDGAIEEELVRITRGKAKRARRERHITSGASIVIKNVLPFLQLK